MHAFIQAVKSFVAWEWISSVTKSLFKLASYIVELPMVASGVYIMIATGIPGAGNAHWYNLAFGVLLSAPEVLAPGAFFRAETMQSRGKLHAAKVTRGIAGAMLFFAALTFSSVMIFHFPNEWLQAIMFCRVMTALGYSIITRIDMDHGVMPTTPPALQQLDSWPLVALAAHLQTAFEKQLAELASTQKTALAEFSEKHNHASNLTNLQVQRLLAEVQNLQNDASEPLDYDALVQCVMTRLQAEFDARQKTKIEPVEENMTHQIDAPKPRQKRISAPKNDASQNASKKILTMRQPSASTTDKKTRIHTLLDEDESLSSYRLAALVGCSEPTARRIKNEWIDARHDASKTGEYDAVEEVVLTHDAVRHDA